MSKTLLYNIQLCVLCVVYEKRQKQNNGDIRKKYVAKQNETLDTFERTKNDDLYQVYRKSNTFFFIIISQNRESGIICNTCGEPKMI